MTRGRKPQPTAQKRLAGNPGRRPLNEREPEIEPALMDPPEHLGEEARKEWERVMELLFRTGIITELDRSTLCGYCDAWATYVNASQQVQQYGAVLVSKKTKSPFASPYLNVMAMALKQMNTFAIEMGMTPSSRSKVTAAEVKPDDSQGKLRFFSGEGA